MRNATKRNLVRAAMMPIFAAMFTIACYGQDSKAAAAGRLVGTWDAAVTLRDCATGDVIRTFASIASFNMGGTSIGSTSGLPQSSRTPEHGVWRHLRGNEYAFKFKSFNFDPAGAAVSYSIVEHRIELDETGNNYISYGTARFFLLNGIQVGAGCSDAIGTRFSM